MGEISKAEIDRLGERLRVGPHSEADLRLLDEYRQSFEKAFERVVDTLRIRGLNVTQRSKTNVSVVAKLRREPKMLLSRMQDIAGCRIEVKDIIEQEKAAKILKDDFPGIRIKDRRNEPSHGYRALHAIAKIGGHLIEVQVRSKLQHIWAELSEKTADRIDPAIKYGNGHVGFQALLQNLSLLIEKYEVEEQRFGQLETPSLSPGPISYSLREEHEQILNRDRDMILVQLDVCTKMVDDWSVSR